MTSKHISDPHFERLIDFTYLDELSDDDVGFKASMINQFIDNLPKNINEMRDSYEKKNWESLRRIAHKFKPQLGFMGINAISDDIEKIEQYAYNESALDKIPNLINKADEVCQKAVVQLKEELDKITNNT